MASARKPDLSIDVHSAEIPLPLEETTMFLDTRNEDPRFSLGVYYTNKEVKDLLDQHAEQLIHIDNDGALIHTSSQLDEYMKYMFKKRLTLGQINSLPRYLSDIWFGYYHEALNAPDPQHHPDIPAAYFVETPRADDADEELGKRIRRVKRKTHTHTHTHKRKAKKTRKGKRKTRRGKKKH